MPRTVRAFPDQLWRRLDMLEPLIRCCAPSADLDRGKVSRLSIPLFSPTGVINVDRLHHLLLSGQSSLGILTVSGNSRSSHSSIHFFGIHLELSTCLFPNLRVLRWLVLTGRSYLDLTAIMHRLLSYRLVSLSVSLNQTHVGIDSFLQNYVLLCPGSKSVRFDISHFQPGRGRLDTHQLSQAIRSQEHLESIQFSVPIDDIALRHVMLSPQLRVRVVSLVLRPKESNLGNIHIPSADTPFRNVKKLELHTFHTFRLRLRTQGQAEAISAFLTTLASPQCTDSLQSIHLTFGGRYDLSDSEQQVHGLTDNATFHCLTHDTLLPGPARVLQTSS
ncbi:hypothetical protein OG21DRAFT_223203 [Imleria badia]|nr:hypothetical protein OG21DRAFT_223203 [Imleria badia]